MNHLAALYSDQGKYDNLEFFERGLSIDQEGSARGLSS